MSAAAAFAPSGIRTRTLPALLNDVHDSAARLALVTRNVKVFLPTTDAIDDMLNTCEGLRQSLCELRPQAISKSGW